MPTFADLCNKMATLEVIPSRLDNYPPADPVPDARDYMLSLMMLIQKGSGYVKLTVGSIVGSGTGSAGGSLSEQEEMTPIFLCKRNTMSLGNRGFYSGHDVYRSSDLSCIGSISITSLSSR